LRKNYIKAIFGFIFLLSFSIQASESTEVEAFFKRYVALSDAFDTSVAELYLDAAKIHSYRRYPTGLEREFEMPGSQWKTLIVKLMSIAKQRGDTNKFSNMKSYPDGNKIKIKADRYSVLKCYTDHGYYMIIEKNEKNEFRIVEEYCETQPQSDCTNGANASSDDLQSLLYKAESQLKGRLPLMIDDDTRLDSVKVLTGLFQYQYTLVNDAIEDLDEKTFRSIVTPIVIKQACTMPNLKPLVVRGATISFIYNDKNGKTISVINVTKNQCN
jgi:hypothetical protein